jgi:LEA14-like dessication related protein
MVRLGFLACLAVAAACTPAKAPELRVIGVHEAVRHEVVFVQVTNPAARPMKLTKLEYTFAAAGSKISEGEVQLHRDVPPNAAIVVEVPFDVPDSDTPGTMTLTGKLTAELDQVLRTFKVQADVGTNPK